MSGRRIWNNRYHNGRRYELRMENKKTIAFYLGSLVRDGAERVVVNLSDFFTKHGYKVYIVTKLQAEIEYEIPRGVTRLIADISAEEITGSRIKNLYLRVAKLKRIWKEIQPDLIISLIGKNNIMSLVSAKPMGIPVVVSVRSNPARELASRSVRWTSLFLFRFADGMILQTKQAMDYFPKNLQKKSVIMQNSLNESFVGREVIAGQKNEIVLVGRLDENKNQIMAIKAFEELADQYPDWQLKLYGEGECKNQWIEETKKLSCSDRIHFCGQQERVADVIAPASIFILTSKQEGMPNALIEAMALGLAVISTDCPCGGPADLIEHGKNGLLIPVDDKGKLVECLSELMIDKELRENLGKNAVQIVERLHPDVINMQWKSYVDAKLRKE